MSRERTLVLAGVPRRLSLEKPTRASDAIEALARSWTGTANESARNAEPSQVNFGGLPIAERAFVDALVRYGTYDRYCVLTRTARGKQALSDDLHVDGEGGRLIVRCLNEAKTLPHGEVMVHAACSDSFAAVATRERAFSATTPFHLFLSGLSDPMTVVPSAQVLLAGARPYDCVTPLSQANRLAAERIFDAVSDYYESQWQVRPCFAGRFTNGTLGVDVTAFTRDRQMRDLLRARLHVSTDTTVFLYLGRLGPTYKADLFPLAHTFYREFVRVPRRVVLILAGYDEGTAATLLALVRALGAESQIKVIADIDSTQKTMLYWMADVFVSPSDNAQEALGITVMEAMAAGLPVIASDWDGYRESVQDGTTGFLIKTYGNARAHEAADSFGVVNPEDQHLLHAQNVCIDMPALAAAMQVLVADAGLRERMGHDASRAAARFGWSRAIGVLEGHWDESLSIARQHERRPAERAAVPLFRVNMSDVHAHYPSGHYSDDDLVSCASGGPDTAEVLSHLMDLVAVPCARADVYQDLYSALHGRPEREIGELVTEFAAARDIESEQVRYYLFRLIKYGVLKVAMVGRRPRHVLADADRADRMLST